MWVKKLTKENLSKSKYPFSLDKVINLKEGVKECLKIIVNFAFINLQAQA